ncbi:MAG TPA: hypothetical protein VFW66_07145 [Gemmatimonadales bacterium]|nr:hypothetical protein [Gemmatimonadales bacterium]
MSPGSIPEDVDRFLARHVDTIEHLEVLLLIYRSPSEAWTADAVARALYSQPTSAARRLALLREQGLAKESTEHTDPRAYSYGPATPELDATVRRLAETYRERRVAVITAIASRPMENVRAFSDAFRLRKPAEE